MDLSKILNDCEDPRTNSSRNGPSSSPPALSISRDTTSSHLNRPNSLSSLTPLKSALPSLSRTISEHSEPAASPVTPSDTPESFERDTKRHHYSGPQRPQLNPHQRRHPPRSHPYSPQAPMDPYNMAMRGEYPDTLSLMGYPQPLMPDMSHMQMPVVPQQPLPPYPREIPLAPMEQQGSPANPPQTPVKPQRKNSYPCPVSKQYGCSEHFTTSGHAARHAKKHTGKKDAICPECQKAFTRKDNMEQHRRTHLGGRTSKSSSDESRQRKHMKLQQQQKKAAIKTPEVSQIEPDLPMLSMPSAIIDAQSLIASDPAQLIMLDPQLQSSPMQSPFADDMTTMSMSVQQQPMYSMNEMTPIAPMSNMPQSSNMIRDSHSKPLHDQMHIMTSVSSPSTMSSSSKHDTPTSPVLSLDALADAAASRWQ